MKISNIREAPILRAYLLINQEKNKKLFKSIQPEISKMSELFGPTFDKDLHLILFNEIDFKDLKGLQKSKETKIQYFLQDFPQFIEKSDFVNIFSEILMNTENAGTTTEIFNGLNKQFKLSIENQLKLLISFIMSDKEKYQEEAKNLLLEKCEDIYKEKIINNLTESTVSNLLLILDNMKNEDDSENREKSENQKNKQIDEYYRYFMNYEEECNSCQTSADDNKQDNKQISSLEKILDMGNEGPVEIEKLFIELGPFIIGNKINISNSETINSDIDVERLGNLIIYIINNPFIKMTEELKEINKNFLESLIKNNTQNLNSNNINFDEAKKLLEESINKDLSWDLEAIYKLFKEDIDNMDINQILNSLDNPLFCIKEKKKFEHLIEILHKLNIFKEDNEDNKDKFFKNLIFTKWNNEINQIEFIDFMINNEVINENSYYGLKNYNGNKVSEGIDSKILEKYSNNSNIKHQYLIDNWKILDLIEILLQLSKGDYYNSVKDIFKWPIQNIPEIISLVLASINPDADSFLYDELTLEVISKILTSKNQNQEIINEIWNINKNLIISFFNKMWEPQQELSNLGALFDIINTKLPYALPFFVNSKYYNFSVNLAIYASKRGSLNLKQWLEERLKIVEDEFVEAILDYIKKNIIMQCNGNSNILEKAQLSRESLAYIIENIIKVIKQLSQKTKKYFDEIYKNTFDLFEEIQIQSNNIEEIVKEANQILNSMFNEDISVDDVIDKLINYNNSKNQKDDEIYACLIHSIFDEIRFFHLYPEKQIKKIAELFGKIININAIDGILVTIALKYIFEGIKIGKGTLYTFGTVALNQFIGKISNWPNYMNSLIDIPELKNEKDLYQNLLKQYNESKKKEKGINSENSRGDEGESILESGDKNIEPTRGREYSSDKEDRNIEKQYDKLKNRLTGPTITKISTNENQSQIPEEIITKIKFIFVTPNKPNFQDNIKDLKTIFNEDKVIKWFGQYFVNSLLITENFQNYPKYYEIFDLVKNKELHKEIIKSTIKTVKKYMANNSDTLISESKSKEILKNLGLWLGEYKISKDRPILAKDLDFKSFILAACENGKLHLAIPFIYCVFKYAPKSKVFKASNPWINSILNILAELNINSAVEPYIKEDIKNLFTILQVDINSWELPKNKVLENIHIKPNSNYYGREIDKDFFYKKINELDDYINNLLGIFNSESNLYSRNLPRKNSSNNNNNSNSENNLYNQNSIIKLLAEVMSNSIQEIIPEIVEKCVKTSVGAAISLVNKDFMYVKNEGLYNKALEDTMKMLALSLSKMNSKELLKKSIDNEFSKILSMKNLSKKTIEKIIQQPNPEFLSIGLEYIKNFIDKDTLNILYENSFVKEVLEKRRQNNANNISNNNIYLDNKHLKEYKKIKKILPDKLQPNEKCISEEELKIYDKFRKIYETMNSKEGKGKNSFLNTVYRILKEVLDNMSGSKDIFRDYGFCMHNIQNESQKTETNYDDDDQQLVCLEKIISESKIDKNLAIHLARTTLDYAINGIKNGNNLLLNVYSYILKGWTSLNSEISDDITKKILGYDDIFIRYKYELYHNFIKKKIIDTDKLEKYFIEILDQKGSDLLARNLLTKIITKSRNSHSYYYDDNSCTYYALFNNNSLISSYFLDINTNPILSLKHNDQNSYRKISSLLECVNRHFKNEDNPNISVDIRKEMKNILKIDNMNDNYFIRFMLIICEICIKGPLESHKNIITLCFPHFAALIIYTMFYIKENFDKIKKFQKVIFGIYSFFHKDYIKSEKNLNQRAYFRLIYNLLYLLNKNSNDENILDSEYKKINYLNIIISDLLKLITPNNYPIFAMTWLEIISCNIFISNFLESSLHPLHSKKKDKNEKYEKYLSLLVELLNYLDSLNDKIISDYNYIIFIEKVYKFFFLLSNSYPEFISSYYYQLITSLSGDTSNFIQLKNIILSANPKNQPMPDLEFEISNNEEDDKIEDSNSTGENNNNINFSNNTNLYSSIKKTTTILFDSTLFLEKKEIKIFIDKYISEEKDNYLENFIENLAFIDDKKEENQIFNAIIIYWSQSKHKHYLSEKSIKSKEIILKFYLYLLQKLNENQRNSLINAILNSLRFPCVQTMSYSLLFQELLFDIKNDEIKEHLLNNLLERLLYKPIPWGLKYTMINLYKKDKFIKMIKPFIEKYKLNEILQKIVNNCKENNLKNFFLEN